MKLYDLLDKNLLNKHLDNGMVGIQEHPSLPLLILNYTHKAAYEPAWGDGTIDWCRGLIVNINTDEIVARPFKKFHNLNTPSIPETMFENLPQTGYFTTEKLDGSLGIYYDDGNGGAIATRGSFTSPQAKFATKWFKGNLDDPFWYNHETPLFEIICPENRIVVDYGDDSLLALIGIMDKETGKEVPWPEVQRRTRFHGVVLARDLSGLSIAKLMGKNEPNQEGFVVTFNTGLKVKIKMEDYKRLHRIVTGMNPHTIWESLRDGKDLPTDDKLPENFKRWAKQWVDKLTYVFNEIFNEAQAIYLDRPIYDDTGERYYRAACARYFGASGSFQGAVGNRKELLPVLFAMLDGKDPSPVIWKQIEPRGDDKSFKINNEEDF